MQVTTERLARSQRLWARIAGLMFWVVLVADLAGMQIHSATAGRSLMLAGSLFTVPLALGLYYAVRPAQPTLAASAFGFRIVEAVLGVVSTVAGFAAVHARLTDSRLGAKLLDFVRWNSSMVLGALVFTVGSTIFFYLFV